MDEGAHPVDLAPSSPAVTRLADPEDKLPAGFIPPAWLTARKTAAVVAVLLSALLVLSLLRALKSLLIIVFISLFLSLAIEPGVRYLARRGMRRGIATWLIFLVFLGFIGVFLGLAIPAAVRQITRLANDLPGYIDGFQARYGADKSNPIGRFLTPERIESAKASLEGALGDVVQKALGLGVQFFGALLNLLTIGLLTWYLAADGPKWRRAVASALPPHRQRQFVEVYELALGKMGGYVYSRLLLAGVAGGTTAVILLALRVPNAFVLGFFTGMTSFIPVIGTYLGAVAPVLIATVGRSVTAGIITLIWIVVYQQIENTWLGPKIQGKSLDIHPAVAFASVLVGGALLGAVGALLALPAAGIVIGVIQASREYHPHIESEFLVDDVRRRSAEPPPAAATPPTPSPST